MEMRDIRKIASNLILTELGKLPYESEPTIAAAWGYLLRLAEEDRLKVQNPFSRWG